MDRVTYEFPPLPPEVQRLLDSVAAQIAHRVEELVAGGVPPSKAVRQAMQETDRLRASVAKAIGHLRAAQLPSVVIRAEPGA